MNENFYLNSRFKIVKFNNFETPSPNFAAPSASISLPLINLRFKMILDILLQASFLI